VLFLAAGAALAVRFAGLLLPDLIWIGICLPPLYSAVDSAVEIGIELTIAAYQRESSGLTNFVSYLAFGHL
jgi:hypothetical protein